MDKLKFKFKNEYLGTLGGIVENGKIYFDSENLLQIIEVAISNNNPSKFELQNIKAWIAHEIVPSIKKTISCAIEEEK